MGGAFYDAAGIPTADRLARWDGSAWSALGSNGAGDGALNDEVDALAVTASGGDLYVGGYFFDAAGIASADHVALWGPAAFVAKPDGLIRLGAGAFVGNDIYNATGAGQSRTRSAAKGKTMTFGISIQNDGNGADSFTVKAAGAVARAFTVKYFQGTTDVTAAVVAGSCTTPALAPGATCLITAKVAVRSTAASGSKVTRLVTVTSNGDNAKKDAVKFIAKRT